MRWSSVLARWFDRFRSSFWFVPSLLVALAVVLALVTLRIDRTWTGDPLSWLYTGGAEGARQMLGTIAGSAITVAGVVFSITTVALSLASQQFGPRILRNFMLDTGNQVTLGVFIATFLYCLLIVRTVRGMDDLQFVPHISVSVGVALAVVSVGVLIYFIHHVANSIRVENVIARVARELHESIDRLYPETLGEERGRHLSPAERPDPSMLQPVRSSRAGYLQIIDQAELMATLRKSNAVAYLPQRPGKFVFPNTVLAELDTPSPITAPVAESVRSAFHIDSTRTPSQDVEFPIDQLVEIALRALSPSMNDPFTAISCIDHLGAGLQRLARRHFPAPERADQDGRLRIVARTTTFRAIVETCFDQIRQAARGSPAVTLRLLETLTAVAAQAAPERREVLLQYAELVYRSASSEDWTDHDKASLEERRPEPHSPPHQRERVERVSS